MPDLSDLLLYCIEVLLENMQLIDFHDFVVDLGGLRGPSKQKLRNNKLFEPL